MQSKGPSDTLVDLAKWILVNRHCMIGSNPDAPLEKWCYCGWRGIGLLAHSQHEADERVKEIVERLTQVQAEARELCAQTMCGDCALNRPRRIESSERGAYYWHDMGNLSRECTAAAIWALAQALQPEEKEGV